MKKKVHLVLGSGGARGIAHIGVIEELLKNDFEIIEVIGCSMGAVVGGIYCADKLEDYKNWMLSLKRKDVFDLLDFTLTSQGFVKGEKLFNKHIEVTGQHKIDDFDIPFTAVATDMKNNEEIHFKSGDLYKALRASVSIPGFFVPVVQDGKVLVDGGVLNPLPVNLINKKEDAFIIAVDLNARPVKKLDKKIEKSVEDEKKWYEKLLPGPVKEMAENLTDEDEKDKFSLIELMDSTFSFTQDRLTELMLELHPPDLLVKIPRNASSTFEFYKAKELIQIGKKAFNDVREDL